MLRFVEERREPVFETIDELLMDKTILFSKLAGKRPVLARVKEELIKLWRKEAQMSRALEEFAR